MFSRYTLRPDQTHAIYVTELNYPEVADYLAEHIADDRGVRIIDPGTQGQGRPRLQFFPRGSDRPVLAGIPGVLQRDTDQRGNTYYLTSTVGTFRAQWQRADD